MRKLIISIALALLLVLIPVSGVLADTSQNVTVTATPGFISIANAPTAWVINDVADAGGKTIAVNTTYYSNPVGDTTPPNATVEDGDCRFTVTNTSSIVTNIVVNFPDHTGGDASTNGNTGSAGATTFGAYGYVSGELFSAKVVLQNTSSANLIGNLAATTNFKWGIEYSSQTDAWTSGTSMSSTVTMTATQS